MNKIKICGIRRKKDIEYVNIALPDYIGFILSSGFSRSIDFDRAKMLKSLISPKIKVVGVFVNDNIDYINKFIDERIIDLVQLHGDENNNFCKKISLPVIKMIKCNDLAQEKIKEYENIDYFLFDSGCGTGKTFDWSKMPKTNKPYFLAGGLNINNIKSAKKFLSPYCFDVSSGVETNSYKDKNKILTIVRSVKNE